VTKPYPMLQHLLLDLLSTQRPPEAEAMASLDEDDWQRLRAMLRMHRLSPLLHWRLTTDCGELSVPETIKRDLAAAFNHASRRNLAVQRELVLLHRILAKANIPYIALKGAYLAYHAYPQPGLRPLRDLDILVPDGRALSAFQHLCDRGYVRPPQYLGDPEAAMKRSQHLPPILSPAKNLSIEIHTRLFDPDGAGVSTLDLADDPALADRVMRITVAGEALRYLSPTDCLLHLIVHAAYDHLFNNGPLLLSDIAYLLASQPIDWELFWQLATRHKRLRGSTLILQMVERYHGPQPIIWHEGIRSNSADLSLDIATCSLTMLGNNSVRKSFDLYNGLKNRSLWHQLQVLRQTAFPSRSVLASKLPVKEDSPFIYFWLIKRWQQQLANHLPGLIQLLRNDRLKHEAKETAGLQDWLQKEP
jgi:hypothetical protein